MPPPSPRHAQSLGLQLIVQLHFDGDVSHQLQLSGTSHEFRQLPSEAVAFWGTAAPMPESAAVINSRLRLRIVISSRFPGL